MSVTTRLVVWSQLSFFAFLGVCIGLMPRYLLSSDQGGISNYGIHAATVVPYTLALLVSGVLLLVAARTAPAAPRSARVLRAGMCAVGVLSVLVLASTYAYKVNTALHTAHVAVASVAVVVEIVLGAWIAATIRRRPRVTALACCALVAGGALAALTLASVLHLLFVSQLLTSASFAVLLIAAAAATWG